MEIIEARDPVVMNGFTRRRRQGIGGRKLALDMMPEDRVAFRLMLEASQGHGMASIRDWLQKRFNSLDLVHASKSTIEADKNKSDCLASAVVITPKNIPDFVIPSNPHRKRLVKQSKSVCSPSSVSLKEDNLKSSRFQKLKSSISEGRMFTKNTSLRQGRTRAQSDQSSYKSQHLREQQIDIIVDSQSDDGHTTEPDTRIANRSLHLPHLTAVTSYGFPTLLESPHTRRKESLLLGSASADDIHKLACKKNALPSMHRSQPASPFDDISTGPYTDSLLVPGVYSLNSSTMSLSNNSSPSDSPISIRSYYRRRSSAPSLTSDEESVDEASFQGRFSQPSSQEMELLGELKLSVTFNKSDSTLRVLLIKAENLIHNDITDRAQLSMFVKLDVTGKNKKYESNSVKGANNPIFNEEITLTNITQDTLDNCTLRLRVCNQLSLRRYHTIGEVLLPLHALSLEQGEEVRMWRDLQPKSSNQNPGVINVSAKFSPKQDNLSITVIEAQNLHKSQLLAGFPDTYVKVIVEQEGTGTIKKHTRVRKSTTHPVFKETFVFCVSPKVELIRYTSVTIQLMSRGHLMHDTVLGEMRLGHQSATDDAQIHWTNIMQNVDKDIQQWHYLSPLNKTG